MLLTLKEERDDAKDRNRRYLELQSETEGGNWRKLWAQTLCDATLPKKRSRLPSAAFLRGLMYT